MVAGTFLFFENVGDGGGCRTVESTRTLETDGKSGIRGSLAISVVDVDMMVDG